MSCSVSDSAGLGLRLGVGAELAINDYLGFNTGLGVDHQRLSEDVIDGCAPGLGASTYLGARFGFVLTAGRPRKAPPPRPAPPPPDRDRDGILDAADACPLLVGVPSPDPGKNGCPPPGDSDGDGITDDIDACPAVAGVASPDPRKHGCPPPPDRDGDKVIDEQDACPDTPGVATSDPATNGCPPDTDGDGIRDDKDACPAVKGVPSEEPAKHGCPLVVFTDKEIKIAQQVQFETDRALIRPESDPLLDEIARVILEHPEILKVEVQGHTDNSGSKARNKVLSKARAEAVLKALVKRKVDPKALESAGYGDTQPIADNGTPEGKAQNRRVQLKILQKK
ncbi:MAG: OmpA family protein [Polyangiaceae bacterium]|nr:OmpA family protein [Polyangiaceae bacterium]